jgi:hypothetical protein
MALSLLLQAQRHEAGFAVRVGDEQHRDLLALGLELIEPALQVGRVADALILDLDYKKTSDDVKT